VRVPGHHRGGADGRLARMAASAKAAATAGRARGSRRLLVALAVVLLAAVGTARGVPAAGAHGHRAGGKGPHEHELKPKSKPKPPPPPKPAQGKRLGVDFSLRNGEYDSHLMCTSDTGCFTKTSEEDTFSVEC